MKDIRAIEAMLNHYEKELHRQEKSKSTIEKYIRNAKAFFSWLGQDHLDKEKVIDYKQSLIEKGYAVRSINAALAGLGNLLDFMNRPELKVKALRIQQKIFRPEENELTKAEYERLCLAAESSKDIRLLLILRTICSTGIRVSELKYITAEAVLSGEATISCKAKTRTVFLVKALRQKLLKYIVQQGIQSGPIFVSRDGNPLDRTTIWRKMKKICKAANVEPRKVYPHNLRHLFARIFYGIEKDIAKLADVLGHSSINTTRIYIISTGTEHRKFMEKLKLV